MIARRQFLQTFLPALAALALPLPALALPTGESSPRPAQPHKAKVDVFDVEDFRPYQVKLIGVGGAGGNVVNHLIACGLQDVEFICANTDAQALIRSGVPKTIQLGRSGLGTGGNTDHGREAATETESEIRTAIEGSDLLFITAGMGGGTGTGAAPVIARIAKDMGILSVGMVTMPFEFEGERRLSQADAGLIALRSQVDSLIVQSGESLLEVLGDEVTLDYAFAYQNEMLKNAMINMTDAIKRFCAVSH